MDRTLISILSGLGAMFGWGTSDFLANNASDKIGHTRTFFWSQIAGLVLMGLVGLFLSTGLSSFSPPILILIVVAGIAYALGYLYFYNGFEIGNVSVVSAAINLQNVFVIAISYFVFGQTLTFFQIPALLLLMIGVTLVSVNFKDLTSGEVSLVKGIKETLIATMLFGIIFWPVNEYIVERVDWISASFMIKLVAIVFVMLMSKTTKRNLAIPESARNMTKVLIAIGCLEAIGIISMSYGVSLGDAIIVAPIASALTIVTVSLAVIFLKEKLTRTQWAGIGLTMLGIFLTGF